MSIISIQRDHNNNISIVRMQVSDTLEDVSMTDYILNNQEAINDLNGGTWQWFITDMILVASSDGNAFYEFVDDTFATVVIFGEVSTGTINPGLTNNLPYYAAPGKTLSPLSSLANAVLATNGATLPALTNTLPLLVQTNITSLGTIGTGVWNGTPVTVPYGGTGDSSFTAYSVICGGTTSTGVLQNVSGLGTSGFILTSNGAGALPTWQANAASGTVSPGTMNALAYYATAGTTISPITTANSSVLVTTGMGVPGYSTTLPSGLTIPGYLTTTLTSTQFIVGNGSNIATAVNMSGDAALANTGAVTVSKIGGVGISLAGAFTTSGAFTVTQTYTGNTNVTFPTSGTLATTSSALTTINANSGSATVSAGAITINGGTTGLTTTASGSTVSLTGTLILANGGSNASLTASNGGIVYSTATAMAILAGTATARQMLQSGTSAAPAWSTATWPATTTINQLLYSSSANTVVGLATANSSVLATDGSGVPSLTTSLPTAVQVGVNSLNSGTSASSSTFWRGDGTWSAPSGSGTVNSGTSGQLAYYASSTNAVSGTNAGTGVLTALGNNVTGSGGIVLATSPTLTTPALGTPSSGVLTNCTGLTASGVAANSGAGIPVQVQFSSLTTAVAAITATTPTDIGLSVTITPTASTSTVLVRAVLNCSTNVAGYAAFQLVRGSTAIGLATSFGSRTAAGTVSYSADGSLKNLVLEWLDSPATTSSTTYKVQAWGASVNSNVIINATQTDTNTSAFPRTVSVITVMEIK